MPYQVAYFTEATLLVVSFENTYSTNYWLDLFFYRVQDCAYAKVQRSGKRWVMKVHRQTHVIMFHWYYCVIHGTWDRLQYVILHLSFLF